jgi:hypothetical protein
MKLLITTLIGCFTTVLFGQNLIPNGGFEKYKSLPDSYGEYQKAKGWSNVNGNTGGPPHGSPDYFHTSGSVGDVFGTIAPNSGKGQMGFYTYHESLGDAREYISTELAKPLIPGQRYQLTFYLTNGSGGSYTARTDNIGVHFSVGGLKQEVDEIINVTPQIEVEGIVDNSSKWEAYTFVFTASDASTDITFGNFKNDAATTAKGGTAAYYFIDDIELIPLELTTETIERNGIMVEVPLKDKGARSQLTFKESKKTIQDKKSGIN